MITPRQRIFAIVGIVAIVAALALLTWHYRPVATPGAGQPVTATCPNGHTIDTTWNQVFAAAQKHEAAPSTNGGWLLKCPTCSQWAPIAPPTTQP